ncbi:MAG: hypothetical protein ACU85E_13725 [Gammaproteobacteria bacterium]
MTLIRIIRVLLLLTVFAVMAFYAKTQKLKSRSWSTPLEVVIYPINGDNDSPVVEDYIKNLDNSVFAPIDDFFKRESRRYGIIASEPTITRLGPIMTEQPPVSPAVGSDFVSTIWWGIRFRYWAFQNTPDSESNLHRIRVFVHYHEALEGRKLQHSLGLDKGLLAVVHAFAAINQDQQNNVVIAHEILHTVWATDKYGANGEPVFPAGYAEPDKKPLYPQNRAEIMAGRIPLTINTSRMADNLEQCMISPATALEINWLKSQADTN